MVAVVVKVWGKGVVAPSLLGGVRGVRNSEVMHKAGVKSLKL